MHIAFLLSSSTYICRYQHSAVDAAVPRVASKPKYLRLGHSATSREARYVQTINNTIVLQPTMWEPQVPSGREAVAPPRYHRPLSCGLILHSPTNMIQYRIASMNYEEYN